MVFKKKVELMSPAGDWSSLTAAINNGANAVYLGLKSLNMRATANNFSEKELFKAVSYAHEKNVKVYLTINNIIFNNQLNEMKRLVTIAKKAKIDMIIAWDHSVIKESIKQNIPVCLSTQASVSNVEAARFYKNIGVKRIVLARECSLNDIKRIKEEIPDLEIEVFIHGALCVALSGRCFMSHHLFNQSANCGACLQPCRREYIIYDPQDKYSLIVGRGYVMSSKDLCLLEDIEKILESGVDALKIEGRKRSADYVAKTTKIYREAIDAYYEKKDLKVIKKKGLEELKKVFNRGFTKGFYFNYLHGKNSVTDAYGSKSLIKKIYVGKVINFYKKPSVALIKIEASSFKKNDTLYFIGPTTGFLETKINELRDYDENNIMEAKQGEEVTVKIPFAVRKNDKVFLAKEKTE